VGKEITVIEALADEAFNANVYPSGPNDKAWDDEKAKEQQRFDDNQEPWLLFETDRWIQQALLHKLPTISKEPKDFVFRSDHPPMIVIQCLEKSDYEALYKFKSVDNDRWKSTDGFVPMDSLLLDSTHPIYSNLKGCITIVRSASEDTKLHEEQHLFYERYVETKKTNNLRALDELAAYLKEGRYDFTTKGIFSHISEESVVGL